MAWKVWTRLREAYDWAERLHFGQVIWEGLKGLGWSSGGGLLMSFGAALAEWSVFAIVFAGIVAFVAVMLLYIAIGLWRLNRKTKSSTPDKLESKPLQVTIGEGHSFRHVRSGGDLYSRTVVLHIEIRNDDRTKAAVGCKVQITDIAPDTNSRAPWLLKDNFILAAGDNIYVPLVSYREADNPIRSDHSDTSIEVCSLGAYAPLLPLEENTLTIKMTAIDMPPCEIQCVVWKDLLGKLRIRPNKERSKEEKTQELRDVLGAFAQEGVWRSAQFRDENKFSPESDPWDQKVKKHLATHHGSAFVTRYNSALPEIRERVSLLGEFIEELK